MVSGTDAVEQRLDPGIGAVARVCLEERRKAWKALSAWVNFLTLGRKAV
jgi:hypothetical protein